MSVNHHYSKSVVTCLLSFLLSIDSKWVCVIVHIEHFTLSSAAHPLFTHGDVLRKNDDIYPCIKDAVIDKRAIYYLLFDC